MTAIFVIVITAMLVNNVVFSQFLGLCPYFGVSKKLDTALGMSFAVMFVMTLAAAITYVIQHFVLEPLGIGYLQTIAFILVIASLVQLVEIVLKKVARTLYEALGIFLPLITTNCAVLGVAILATQNKHDFIETLIFALASAVGFMIALVIFAGIRERLELRRVPKLMQGTAIAMITAGILSMAFMGFAGLGG
jgi:Na+-translocating ferredoxin:NAD+ oxidoreductase subunit A